jgi:hypothetical protein
LRFAVLFRPPLDFRFDGTFAPFARASDNPIAIACSRLFTLPPLPPGPLRSVPFFLFFIALSTRLLAAAPYFRVLFFLVAIGDVPRSQWLAVHRIRTYAARQKQGLRHRSPFVWFCLLSCRR